MGFVFFCITDKLRPLALELSVFSRPGDELEGRHGRARQGLISLPFFQVAKQEKKKKKTGRAKRRMQYNRRFVNVVPTFGKKKGPNANS